MKRLIVGLVMVAVASLSIAHAAYTWEYAEGKECRFGGDIRLRLTSVDRDTNPDYDANGGAASGPPSQFLRVRERVYGCFDITDSAQLYLRLAHRWHQQSSSPLDPNDQQAGFHGPNSGNTWGFPDEVYIDNLYLDLKDVADTDWSLRLGRQDVILGNGVVLLEGTPFDQGRSIYFDGAVASYDTECDKVKLLALYNDDYDPYVFINDQNRVLRRGNQWIVGVDWTHTFDESLNSELYALYVDIDDDLREGVNTVSANNAELYVVGLRVFGNPSEQMSYSIEAAQQYGESAGAADFTGEMIDARVTLKASEGTKFSPALSFEYTYMSGDDANTADEAEGWHPVMAEYPMFREELIPLLRSGARTWTNLNQYMTTLVLKIRDAESYPVTLTGRWAAMTADYGEAGTGGGDNIGHLFSGFMDIGVRKNVTLSLEAATFSPGNFYADGHSSEWLRCQTVITF